MMENYLENRSNLLKVVQLVDVRHAPSAQDVQMYDYLRYHGLDGIVVATKADKVSRNELNKNINIIKKTLKLGADDIIVPVSSLKKTGVEALLDVIEVIISGSTAAASEESPAEE